MSVTIVLDITESLSSLTASNTALAGLYHIRTFLVVSSMITRVKSMAIPNDRMSEKFVMKLSDSPIQLSVKIDTRKARGIERAAMSDSLTPIKKNTHANTRIIVWSELELKSV